MSFGSKFYSYDYINNYSDPYANSRLNYELEKLDRRHREERDYLYRAYQDRYYYPTYQYNYSYLNNASVLTSLASPTNTKEITPMPSKKFIIIGTSGAAAHPTEHTNLASAEIEAARLSKNKPGEEFTIFQTTKSYKVEEPKPVVKVYA